MEEEKSFTELFEESMNAPPPSGEIVKGRVVRVDEDDVFIDFGFKSEGVVPLGEFQGENGEPQVNVGDEVDIILENWTGDEGLPKLSKRKADVLKEHDRLQQAYVGGRLVTANIVEKVKGGLIADIGELVEIKAFLPASQVDLRPQHNLNQFVGKNLEARIIKMSKEGVVVSRRVYLEEQREAQRKKALSTLREGKIVSGKIVKIIDQGAFVDLGGVEGFVPFSELSWGRIKHPSDAVSVDDEANFRVLKIEDDGKISLSLKQTKQDPWVFVESKYKPGIKVRGKVVSTTDFGVFVELEPGVDGLVHISEITWTKRFRHPKEVVSIGNRVEAVVLEVDVEKRRIGLSLRRVEPSPWNIFKDKNPPGTRIKGKVVNATDKGVFVEVEEGVVGLIRPSDISWKGRANPEEVYKVGDEIEVVVLNVDEENQRIGLGIKQLTRDPWQEALESYKPGETALTGKVAYVKESGIILELENGFEGFIKKSELDREGARDTSKAVKVGDEITAQVTGFDRKKRQISLSKRRYEERLEKDRVSNFMSSQGEDTVKLGDLMDEKLKSLIKEQLR
ncbi:MAG TPA: 30S ribosomal protein S1 [Thermodesulfobacteriota bacterium]|nr:30S ribosomal protein S1 [Thermodesulfobacteriota bacterium]